MTKITKEFLLRIVEWAVTRSSGAGGQHVNKTNSAVVCTVDLYKLKIDDKMKSLIFTKLEHKITQGHYISVRSEEERDQKLNKERALDKLLYMLNKAFEVPKKRIKTKPTKSSVQKRLTTKTHKSDIKKLRQRIKDSN